MPNEVFKFRVTLPDGSIKEAANSNEIPTIEYGGKVISRGEFQRRMIEETVAGLPVPEGSPVYVATGGGYGSFDKLLKHEQESGRIPAEVFSIKGDNYRNHPAFKAEEAAVRAQIAEHLGEGATKQDIDRVYSAFYSNEVNTLIGKKAVVAALEAGKSVAYESASMKGDTEERAAIAKKYGAKTVLEIGDRDVAAAIAALPHIEPLNTAASYKNFAGRVPALSQAFDEVRIYNVDGEEPVLIAQKIDNQIVPVQGQEARYMKFLANANIQPEEVASRYAVANVIADEHRGAPVSVLEPQNMGAAHGLPARQGSKAATR